MDDLAFGVIAFTSMLVVYNPVSAIPVFVALTMEDSEHERRAAALWGVVTSVLVLVVFAAAGTWVLAFFGITTEALQITAGTIFFGMGTDMLQGRRIRTKTTRQEQDEFAERGTTAIIPLGLPTLSGPGAIVTAITLAGQAVNPVQTASVYVAFALVGAVTFPLLVVAPALLGAMGRTGLNVVTRIMGLMIMVVGVQFVINGVGIAVGSWGFGN